MQLFYYLNDLEDKLKTGKVIDIKDERSLCKIIDGSNYVYNDSRSIYLKDEKNKTKDEVVKFGGDVSALYEFR